MKKKYIIIILLTCLTASAFTAKESPYKIKYEPIEFEPPEVKNHEYNLKNKATAFIVEDDKIPVFDIELVFKTGFLNDPKKMPGLCSITAAMITEGGTKNISSDSLNEILDYHAISLDSYCEDATTTISASSLNNKIDLVLKLLTEIISFPAFEKEKLNLLKKRRINSIKNRFDSPYNTINIISDYAVYGKNRLTTLLTEENLNSIEQNNIFDHYKNYFGPQNLTIAVSGKFKSKDILKKLNKTIGKWKNTIDTNNISFDNFQIEPQNDNFFVEKDINQAYIKLGLPLFTRPNKDYFPLILMNYVLGGAPFTSRLGKKIREHEGLAYSIRSSTYCGYFYKGNFSVSLQTKSESAPYAIKLIFNEIKDLLDNGNISDKEISDAKKSYIDAFPSSFESGTAIAYAFLKNRIEGRPDDYFQTYRKRIKSVTKQEIIRAAKKHIDLNKLSICIAGKYEEINKGDDIHNIELNDLGQFNKITENKLEKMLSN